MNMMFFTSPVSNITPPLVSVAMSRSDSRDSTTSSMSSFSSAPMQVSYSASPSLHQSMSSSSFTSTRTQRDSFSNGWLPSPYRSCMIHRSSSSQGFDSSSSYISDDDLLALDLDLAMPPTEQANIQPAASQIQRKEMTTEEQIALLREQQEREQAQLQAQQAQRRALQQRAVRFAVDQRKPRRPSTQSQKRSSTTRRS